MTKVDNTGGYLMASSPHMGDVDTAAQFEVPLPLDGSPSPGQPVLVQDPVSGGWDCPCPAVMRVIGAIVALAALVCMVVFPWVGVPFALGYAILVILSTATVITVGINLTL